MKQVAIYVRVSTGKQELDNQIIELTHYCEKCNYHIYKIFKDTASGSTMNRPAFTEMFEEARRKSFDIVVFWDISRFSRSGTLYTLQKLQELNNLGIEWESYQEQYFKSVGQFKDVVLSILATIAKIEREKISERTKAGLRRATLSGKKLGRRKGSKDKRKRNRRYWKKPKY